MPKAMTVEQVLAASTPRFNVRSGVYFLISGTEIIYVGQSVSIENRMAEHCRQTHGFDSWTCIECDVTELDSLEAFYQQLFQPRMNSARVKSRRAINTPYGMFPSILSASTAIRMPYSRVQKLVAAGVPGWTFLTPDRTETMGYTRPPSRRAPRPPAPLGVPVDERYIEHIP